MKGWIFILSLSIKACFCLAFPHMALLGEFITSNGISNKSVDLVPDLNNPTRIVGGYPATLGPPATAPWQVALVSNVFGKEFLFCGGTLLSHQVVVTAAHCIDGFPLPFTVQLGGLNKSSLPLKYEINKKIVHDDYAGCDYPNGSTIFACDNDIALLILDNEVDFSSYKHIEPASLPADDEADHANEIVIVSGWGKTSFEAQVVSDYLMAVELTLHPDSICKQFADPTYVNYTDNMICASNIGNTTMNACQGDSGGPLVVRGNTSNALLGIVSWGVECGIYPGVYTKVSNYVSWIKEKVNEGVASSTPSTLTVASTNNSANIDNRAGLLLVMLFSSLVKCIII